MRNELSVTCSSYYFGFNIFIIVIFKKRLRKFFFPKLKQIKQMKANCLPIFLLASSIAPSHITLITDVFKSMKWKACCKNVWQCEWWLTPTLTPPHSELDVSVGEHCFSVICLKHFLSLTSLRDWGLCPFCSQGLLLQHPTYTGSPSFAFSLFFFFFAFLLILAI